MKNFKKLFSAVVLLVLSLAVNAQQLPKLPLDPAVKVGKLDNGLTYMIRQNGWPEHMVNFYIAQRVGSIQEEEEQRGLAHFLEHMAFNGSDNFPGSGIVDFTRSIGVQFGSDLNAYTSIDQTVYRVCNVPSSRTAALDSCLLILKDWSCGLHLQEEEIDKERGVIHGEWAMRNNAQQRLMEASLPKIYPGCKYGERLPIGLMSVVDNFTYDELRKYYKKWYRPDNQCIIVVGDINVDEMEQKIKALFSPIKLQENAAQVVDIQVPDNDEPIYFVLTDKEQQSASINIMMKHDVKPEAIKNTAMDYYRAYSISMAAGMLNQRLSELGLKPECPFFGASVGYGNFMVSKTKDAFSIGIRPKKGKDLEALTAVMNEVMRVRQHGYTATELARVKESMTTSIENAYINRDKRTNDHFGDALRDLYLEGETLQDAQTDHDISLQVVQNLQVENINEVARNLISMDDKNLIVFEHAQEKEGEFVPTADQLRQTFEASRKATLEAWVDNTKQEPLLAKLPKKGSIKKTSENKKFDYKELILSNGAKVIIKKTDFQVNEIRMSASAKGGSALYGENDLINLKVFGNLVGMSKLGGFTKTELGKMLAGKSCGVNFGMSQQLSTVSGSSTPKDIETFMQLLYLTFTSHDKDMQSYEKFLTSMKQSLPNRGLKPETAFSDSVTATIYGNNPRFKSIEMADLDKINYDRCLEILKERTANAANYTFTFIGNIDEAVLLPLIEQYIAALPGKKADKVKEVDVRTLFKGEKACKFTRKMESPRPQVMNMYYAPLKYSLENAVMLSYVGQVLSMEMLKQIREDASAAYSCGASCQFSMAADNDYVILQSQAPISDPSKLDMAAELMKKIVKDAAENVDPDKVQKVKDLMLKEADMSVKNNGYWMGIISTWLDEGIDCHTDYKKIVSEMTADKVAAFIKNNILSSGNHAEVLMRPVE